VAVCQFMPSVCVSGTPYWVKLCHGGKKNQMIIRTSWLFVGNTDAQLLISVKCLQQCVCLYLLRQLIVKTTGAQLANTAKVSPVVKCVVKQKVKTLKNSVFWYCSMFCSTATCLSDLHSNHYLFHDGYTALGPCRMCRNETTECVEMILQDVSKWNCRMCRNDTAGSVEIKLQDVSKLNCRLCRNETAGFVEMKLQNVLKCKCRMCRNETAGCVEMKLQDVSKWYCRRCW
jgi:hypothetical protein